MEVCPLCYSESFQPEVQGPKGRLFHLCENCMLVFEEKSNRPDWNEEKERYLEHENSIHQEGYVRHLNQAIKPALNYLKHGATGLDYGCGPVPTLNKLLDLMGFACEIYDPIFFRNILWELSILFSLPNVSNIFSNRHMNCKN
jgi:hypothetical protein